LAGYCSVMVHLTCSSGVRVNVSCCRSALAHLLLVSRQCLPCAQALSRCARTCLWPFPHTLPPGFHTRLPVCNAGAAVRALELLAAMGLAALVTASSAFAQASPLLPALPVLERRCAASSAVLPRALVYAMLAPGRLLPVLLALEERARLSGRESFAPGAPHLLPALSHPSCSRVRLPHAPSALSKLPCLVREGPAQAGGGGIQRPA